MGSTLKITLVPLPGSSPLVETSLSSDCKQIRVIAATRSLSSGRHVNPASVALMFFPLCHPRPTKGRVPLKL